MACLSQSQPAALLAHSPFLTNLANLNLGQNEIGDTGTASLAASTIFTQLSALNLWGNGIGEAGAAAIAASLPLGNLETLNLEGNGIGDAGTAALAESSKLQQLETLNLEWNAIGDAGLVALAASPKLAKLRTLYLRGNPIGDLGITELLSSPRLKPLNARLDPRRWRGEFTTAEISLLLKTAVAGSENCGLSGPDRRMLYRLALGTGFRAAELAAILPEYFDLDAATPVVILPAVATKNRRGATQPLAAELAAELREYLVGRSRKKPVWQGTWSDRSAEMQRNALAAAGISVTVDGPEGDEVRDFQGER